MENKRISVRVITGAKVKKIEQLDDNSLKIWITKKPVEGEANAELIKVIADFFGVAKSSVRIVNGFKSCNKLFEINK